MRISKKKVLLGVVVAFIVIIIIISMSGPQYTEPAFVTNFVILKEGEVYRARFSLMDKDQRETAWDGQVKFIIKEDSKILYESTFTVKQGDFKKYRFVLTGAEFLAYAWTFLVSEVKSGTSLFKIGEAELIFITPGKNMTCNYKLVPLP